jgi:gluconate 2-dehydrogenase gamma chain
MLAALERVFPGSVEAGVPDYLAYWLTQDGFFKGLRAQLEMGFILLDRVALRTYRKVFSNCSTQQQDELLGQFQKGKIKQGQFDGAQFFERLVTLTLEGYFSDPKYGGNRNQVGWKLIGYKPCWWAPRSIPKHL